MKVAAAKITLELRKEEMSVFLSYIWVKYGLEQLLGEGRKVRKAG